MRPRYRYKVLTMDEKSLATVRLHAEAAWLVFLCRMGVWKCVPRSIPDPDNMGLKNGLLLSRRSPIRKNWPLGKVEIKVAGEADLDAYVVDASNLRGVSRARGSVRVANGYRLFAWEELMRKKMAVFQDRRTAPEGGKDAEDLLALMAARPKSAAVPPEVRGPMAELLSDVNYLKDVAHIRARKIAAIRKASAPLLDPSAPYYEEPPKDPESGES